MKGLFTLLLSITFFTPFDQKQNTHAEQLWLGYLNQTRFSNRWGTWVDLQLRTKEDFVHDLSQGVARLGLTYYLRDYLKLTAGYAFFNFFPADAHANISQPEHRIWQQVQWDNKYQWLRLTQRVRLEERFLRKIKNDDELAEGYNFNYRTRYSVTVSAPLSKNAFAPGTFSAVLSDEVMFNFGKEIVHNTFDQNRFFAGLAFHTNAHDNLQFGYMNLFQQLPPGNRYRIIHALRIYYIHNLDLRKNKNI
ncbi:MAG: DUF2490 domain-containing protein [Flavisolibacter sp.]|nr:DUF2490 domain-containing protein [Flavisolibacter sp.]